MQALESTRRNSLVALLIAMAMAFALMAGCGSDEPESTSSSEEATSSSTVAEATATTALEIGDASDSARSLAITNEVGADITFVSLAIVDSQDEPKALNIPGGKWANGDTATVYYGKGDSRSTYEVTFTANETSYTLHNLTLGSIEEATLRVDGTLAYLTYANGGTTVSTLGTEKGLAAMADAGNQETQVEAVTEEPAPAQEPVYYYYYEDYDDEYADEDGDYYEDYDDEYADDYDYGDEEDYGEGYYDDEEYYYDDEE